MNTLAMSAAASVQKYLYEPYELKNNHNEIAVEIVANTAGIAIRCAFVGKLMHSKTRTAIVMPRRI